MPGSTDGRGCQIFSDALEQIRFDWERRAFRSDRSRFVRF